VLFGDYPSFLKFQKENIMTDFNTDAVNIPSENIEKLEKKVAQINKKAIKNGLVPMVLTIGDAIKFEEINNGINRIPLIILYQFLVNIQLLTVGNVLPRLIIGMVLISLLFTMKLMFKNTVIVNLLVIIVVTIKSRFNLT